MGLSLRRPVPDPSFLPAFGWRQTKSRDYGHVMRISDVIRRKGGGVVTLRSDATVRQLLEILEKHRIGAVVVSDDGSMVSGIVSERDVVRHLHTDGVGVQIGR